MKDKRLSIAQRLDIITTLPRPIIEIILCLLPIEEAARTSILSREWRYKWTTIPKLVFRLSMVPETTRTTKRKLTLDMTSARKNMDTRCKLFYAIYQVLLLRQSPIHEFTLLMQHKDYTGFEIDQIIVNLSRNHPVKKFTLAMLDFNVPVSLFSLRQLTDLSLEDCTINHKPIFDGFGCLTSLSLVCVSISKESLLHLLSSSPSLKIFCMLPSDEYEYSPDSPEAPTIMELFKCLPMIEHLTFSRSFIRSVIRDWVPQVLPTSLVHLKYFCFEEMSFRSSDGWTFLAALIKCSPNLEKIKLEVCILTDYYDDDDFVTFEYSDVCFEHLNELEIEDTRNLKPTVEFVKFVLARSPNLKKVIWDTRMNDKNEELELLKILLSVPRASPVQIIVKKCSYTQLYDD